jgi:NADH-quinone oxidoreductase subunit E
MSSNLIDMLNDEFASRRDLSGRERILDVLAFVQDKLGCLSRESIDIIASYLDLPSSKVYGIASFYDNFRFKNVAKYHIKLCNGVSCHIHGSNKIEKLISGELKLTVRDVSHDGLFSFESVNCMGLCEKNPSLTINGDLVDCEIPDEIISKIQKLRGSQETR